MVEEEFDITGSGRKRCRTLERSKLGLGSVLGKTSPGEGDEGGAADAEEEELTPGRKEVDRRKEKSRMTREVDRI